MISPSANYLVVKAGSSEAVKEAAIKTMNYQFDIDQDQGVSLKADPTAVSYTHLDVYKRQGFQDS